MNDETASNRSAHTSGSDTATAGPAIDERKVPAPALPWEGDTRKAFLSSLRRGDLEGLLGAFFGDQAAMVDTRTRHLAQYLLDMRRQDVAVLGDYDAFVRHTDSGDLHQVLKPVKLSLKEGTLYQIPTFKQEGGQWVSYIENPHQAQVTAEGYLRMNAVAGCTVRRPSTVMVDMEERPNPYVQRNDEGDVERIVIACNVAGPSPMTGNVVIVQYVLDMDPRKDLLHMLANVLSKTKGAACRLMHRQAFVAWLKDLEGKDERWRWHWLHLHGGVGYAHDLTRTDVQKAYKEFVNMSQFALRKAQTVSRRNAMKAHPALAVQRVSITSEGVAIVPVVGWTGAEGDLERYTRALDDLARGRLDLGSNVIDVMDTYDPEPEEAEEVEKAQIVDDPAPEVPTLDPETAARNEALAILDELVAMGMLTAGEIVALGYPPEADAPASKISAMIDRAHAILDARGGEE